MPGVPSSRGCDGCRQQKKKCDQKKPACSRCARLRMVCVGSGQRRFKFKEEYGSSTGSNPGLITKLYTAQQKDGEIAEVPRFYSNHTTSLSNKFIYTISGPLDMRYNLVWAYGDFLEAVPQRLGTNEALDISADALISLHSSFCTRHVTGVEGLAKYSRALSVLRVYLDDPIKACSPETLCAVMILLLCQAFIGTSGARWSGHGEGAAQILKARRYSKPANDFERRLLLSLRGPVVFEGLFNHKINFSPEEWTNLVENELDGGSQEGQMMRCLARVPVLLQRGKGITGEVAAYQELEDEANSLYQISKNILNNLHERLSANAALIDSGLSEPVLLILHAHYQRTYGLGLAITVLLNAIVGAFDVGSSKLMLESTHFSKEILVLAEQSTIYRPLGASYMILCLAAAWIGTTDETLRSLIEISMIDYQQDFPWTNINDVIVTELGWVVKQIQLLRPDHNQVDAT